MAVSALTTALTELLNGVEALAPELLAGAGGVLGSLASASGAGLIITSAIISAIQQAKENKIRSQNTDRFISQLNSNYNALVDFIRTTKKITTGLTQEQRKIINLFYSDELSKLESQINNFNTIHSTYLSGLTKLKPYIDNNKLFIKFNNDPVVPPAFTFTDSTRIQAVMNILVDIGITDDNRIHRKQTSAGIFIPYYTPVTRNVLDLQTLINNLKTIYQTLNTYT